MTSNIKTDNETVTVIRILQEIILCTCTVRLWQGREQRVLKSTCPEHGTWAKHARSAIEAADAQNADAPDIQDGKHQP